MAITSAPCARAAGITSSNTASSPTSSRPAIRPGMGVRVALRAASPMTATFTPFRSTITQGLRARAAPFSSFAFRFAAR